jgi:glycolate oxidase iron-sulfur subunit
MDPEAPTEFMDSGNNRQPVSDGRYRFPLADADRCVKCALCLPHCPTYRDSLDENESPRGRIALMQAAAREELAVDTRLAGHLNRCLGCRNCEPVCPADVPYGRLLDAGRAILQDTRRIPRRDRWAAAIMARPRLLGLLAALGRIEPRALGFHDARQILGT